jgi:hypothetical protein
VLLRSLAADKHVSAIFDGLDNHQEVVMRLAQVTMAALIAMPLGALAQNESPPPESTPAQQPLAEGQSSTSCISTIVFSQEFLQKYPNAGGACREVKVENGHKWARFDADVAEVNGSRITADFVDSYDRKLTQIVFDAPSDARVEVNGRSTRFSQLKPGDHLSFWMPDDHVGFYAAPGASQRSKLAVVSSKAVER